MKRIQLTNFKNWAGQSTIEFSNIEASRLIVVVGRNGAGKSSVVEAIEWVLSDKLFGLQREYLNSGNDDRLRCHTAKANEPMSVTIEFAKSNSYDTLTLSRILYNKRKLVAKGFITRHNSDGDRVEDLLDTTTMEDALYEFNLPPSGLERLITTQNDSVTACKPPLELLKFFETVVGTNNLIHLVEEHQRDAGKFRQLHQIQQAKTTQTRQELIDQQRQINKLCNMLNEKGYAEMAELKLQLAELGHQKYELDTSIVESDATSALIAKTSSQKCHSESQLEVETKSSRQISKSLSRFSKQMLALRQELTQTRLERDQLESQNQDVSKEFNSNVNRLKQMRTNMRGLKNSLEGGADQVASLEQKLQKIGKRREEFETEIANMLQSMLLSNPQAPTIAAVNTETMDQKVVRNKIMELVTKFQAAEATCQTERKSIEASLEAECKRQVILKETRQEYEARISEINRALEVICRQKEQIDAAREIGRSDLQQITTKLEDERMSLQSVKVTLDGMLLGRNEQSMQYSTSSYLRRCKQLLENDHVPCDSSYGMLCDIIQPKRESYSLALLSILGSSLTRILVVQDRPTAIDLAKLCPKYKLYGLLIEICNEIGTSRSSDAKTTKPVSGNVVSALDCVNCADARANPVIQRKLGRWKIFLGTYKEAAKVFDRGGRGQCFHFATTDGCLFMGDGEIRVKKPSTLSCPIQHFEKENATDRAIRIHWPTSNPVSQESTCNRVDDAVHRNKIIDLKSQHQRILENIVNFQNSVRSSQRIVNDQLENIKSLDVRISSMEKERRSYQEKLLRTDNDLSISTLTWQKHKESLLRINQISDSEKSQLASEMLDLGIELNSTFVNPKPIDLNRFVSLVQEEQALQNNLLNLQVLKSVQERDTHRLQNDIVSLNNSIEKQTTHVSRLKKQLSTQAKYIAQTIQQLDERILMNAEEIQSLNSAGKILQSKRRQHQNKISTIQNAIQKLSASLTASKNSAEQINRKIESAKSVYKATYAAWQSKTSPQKQSLPQSDRWNCIEQEFAECNVSLDGKEKTPDEASHADTCSTRRKINNSYAENQYEEGLQGDELWTAIELFANNSRRDGEAFGGPPTIKSIQIKRKRRATKEKKPRPQSRMATRRNIIYSDNESNDEEDSFESEKEKILVEQQAITSCPIDLTELEELRERLMQRMMSINHNIECMMREKAIEKYNQLCDDLHSQLSEAKTYHLSAMESLQHAKLAQEQRFVLLERGMQGINDHLGPIFSNLKPDNECYISYPSDPISLFSEGVKLVARFGTDTWRQAANLSGGQQAIVGLSLLLAIQEAYPAPFYILDEIDASLDSKTVIRIGQFLLDKTQRKEGEHQVVCISHRPQMQLFAQQMIGIYQYKGNPAAIAIEFHET